MKYVEVLMQEAVASDCGAADGVRRSGLDDMTSRAQS